MMMVAASLTAAAGYHPVPDEQPPTQSVQMNDSGQMRERHARFVALCEPLKADVFRFLFWLCRERTLAEDLTQETLLRAWRSLDALQEPGAARSWLLTIARRELARTFERKRLDTVSLDAPGGIDAAALATPDAPEQDDEVLDMRRAILELEEGYREPITLQVLFGYSTGEIARHMQLSQQTVLTRLFRARQKLRDKFADEARQESVAR